MTTPVWGYLEENGPSHWPEFIPEARGRHQSPIDIETAEAKFSPKLKDTPLEINYTGAHAEQAENTGASCMTVFKCDNHNLEGGPLDGKYSLLQFHLHWGSDDCNGSEHTIDGERFPGELHLVHYNSEKHDSPASALEDPSGLCVLGIFLKVGKEHEGLSHLTSKLDKLHFKGEKIKFEEDDIDPSCLLPENHDQYWTYDGSLTTPPCKECVKWIVFREPIEVSEDQLEKFRHLNRCDCQHVTNPDIDDLKQNFRPPQPLNDRIPEASFL